MVNQKKRKFNNTNVSENSDKNPQTCCKCDEIISKKCRKIKCMTCLRFFHIECVCITRMQLREISTSSWQCSKNCKGVQLSSTMNNNESSTSDVESENEIGQTNSISYLIQSQKHISNQLDTLIRENQQLKQLIKDQKKIEQRVCELEYQVETLKQEKNDDRLIIMGIPETEKEDLTEEIIKISSNLNIIIQPRDIIYSSRLKSKIYDQNKTSNHPAPIIVTFIHPTFKYKLCKSNKNVNLFTQQIYPEHQSATDKINFRSFLTPFNMTLLNYAKILKNEYGFAHVWFGYNRVNVRKSDKSDAVHIKTKSDVDDIIKNLEKK